MQFDTVRFHTTQLTDIKVFYAETLELPVTVNDDGDVSIDIGYSTLVFHETSNEDDRKIFYHFAVSVPEHRFDDATGWLADRVNLLADDDGQTKFTSELMNSHQVYFADPAGNIGELIARHDHSVASDGPFNSECFLEISEVGLPVRNVPDTLDEFEAEFSLSPWNEPNGIQCIGDTRAMFIVVPVNWDWFPTSTPAEVHPITATVTNSDKPSGSHQLTNLPYQITLKK